MPRSLAALVCLVASCVALTGPSAHAVESIRIGFQTTGTFAWQLDVVRRHGLAEAAGLELETTNMASPDAGKLALNGGTVDVAIVDWLWVARERSLGMKLKFYPYSSAVGAVMTRGDSPLHDLSDLAGHTLSIAGGPLDKSWLIVQAAAKQKGLDLQQTATLQYGAPPLLFAKLLQGEAEASLTFWNFCARLEARGYRRLFDVRQAQIDLGLKEPLALTGYVFSEQFAASHKQAIERFLAVVKRANAILLKSDQEWESLRPLMQVDDEATFLATRDRMREGLPRRPVSSEEADARALFKTITAVSGPELVGPAKELDSSLYYHPTSGED